MIPHGGVCEGGDLRKPVAVPGRALAVPPESPTETPESLADPGRGLPPAARAACGPRCFHSPLFPRPWGRRHEPANEIS